MFTCVQRLLLQRNVHLMLHSCEACLLCSGLDCGPLGDSHAVPNPTRREESEPGLTFSRLYETPCVLYRNILMQRNKHRHPHCLASILRPIETANLSDHKHRRKETGIVPSVGGESLQMQHKHLRQRPDLHLLSSLHVATPAPIHTHRHTNTNA